MVAAKHHPHKPILLSDGGSENCNASIQQYTAKNGLKHLVAQVDIKQSNSMVEATFKTLKYYYLFDALKNNTPLHSALPFVIHDYNNVRPNDTLNGATPNNVYNSNTIPPKQRYQTMIKEGYQQRIRQHQSNTLCSTCNDQNPNIGTLPEP